MKLEQPDVQAGVRKGRETRDQIANTQWIIKKTTEFLKNIYFCFIDCVDYNKLWKILRDGNSTLTTSRETCMQIKKQQLELDMEQRTGSKLGRK